MKRFSDEYLAACWKMITVYLSEVVQLDHVLLVAFDDWYGILHTVIDYDEREGVDYNVPESIEANNRKYIYPIYEAESKAISNFCGGINFRLTNIREVAGGMDHLEYYVPEDATVVYEK